MTRSEIITKLSREGDQELIIKQNSKFSKAMLALNSLEMEIHVGKLSNP